MARVGAILQICLALCVLLQVSLAAETPPPAVKISLPPFNNKFVCSIDPKVAADPNNICTPGVGFNPPALILSYDDTAISARYQHKTPVQLWKRNSKFVASFKAFFTVNFNRDAEFTVRELFSGGGIAFALTPSLSVAGTGAESFGLFPVDLKTGSSLNGKNTKTVAVELDISRVENDGFDPQIPHIGLDINSVKSVKTKYLGDPATVIDKKIGVWIEYDALKKIIMVYTHVVKDSQTPKLANRQLAIKYVGLDLAKEVKEFSYVGFSSRVPETPNGVYMLYDFTFQTAWVQGQTVNK